MKFNIDHQGSNHIFLKFPEIENSEWNENDCSHLQFDIQFEGESLIFNLNFDEVVKLNQLIEAYSLVMMDNVISES